jgi:hypothetical protein
MRLYVPLSRDELGVLEDIARRERRRPQDQAAVLLVGALASPRPIEERRSVTTEDGTTSDVFTREAPNGRAA